MQNIFIDILPPWVETGLQPAFYDLESGTVLQQTARMYAKVRELTTAFNQFSEDVSTEINNFEHETNTEIERFENATNDEIERFENATNDEIERFEGVINDTVEEYIGKFNELHDYVQDYFDNLDVQEEINNKLDEMLDDGILQEIITTYVQSNVTWTFDNVSSLTSATNLIAGSFARTLGYYNRGDGGGATYKIVASSDADNNHLYETINDNLKAELQFDGVININALGADNTATNDSSSVFNTAFAFINSQWLLGNNKINTVVCEGKYKWTSQVVMPPCAKLRGNGYVTILTDVTGSALNIKYLSASLPSNPEGNHQDWLLGELISFDRGGLIKNIGTDNTNTCIEIGADTNEDAYHSYARYKMANFRIYNYNIGILHNKYNIYICKYNNISFEGNTIGVQYGKADAQVTNSGENICFTDCLFASGTNGVKWFTDGFDSNFNNCSFDYITTIFYKAGTRGFTRINLYGCHLEGFTHIVDNLKRNDFMAVNQCGFFFSQDTNKFVTNSDNATVIFSENKFCPILTNVTDPTKLLDSCKSVRLFNNSKPQQELYYGFLNQNLITNGFDNVATGAVASVAVNAVIGDWKVVGNNSNFTGTIVQDDFLYTGHKSLVLSVGVENANNKNFHLESNEFIPIDSVRSNLVCNNYMYNIQGSNNIYVYYYDENKTEISRDDGYHYQGSASAQNTWYMSAYAHSSSIPSNAKYVKFRVQYSNINNSTADPVGTDYKIGGLIVN